MTPEALPDPLRVAFADDYHVYAIEWQPGSIVWSVDSISYKSVVSTQVPGTWVFDHPLFIILNVAVGGYWPGVRTGGRYSHRRCAWIT